MSNSRIEQIIEEIEDYIDSCKGRCSVEETRSLLTESVWRSC
ncbi:MAG: hypothetical protein V8S36_06760 [Lachnospiraceae bacterium]